jgi:hypothetical protein
VGRRTRTVPPSLRRALDRRDGGCRFPGCTSRFCDAHHVVHWADGGATRLDNLVLLCRRHHRAVHEEGFRIELAAGGAAVRVLRPDGVELPAVPPAPVQPLDPVAALMREHESFGLDIGAWTAVPHWLGERLDVSQAIGWVGARPQ